MLINFATTAKVSRHAMTHNSPKDGMSQNPFPFESIEFKKKSVLNLVPYVTYLAVYTAVYTPVCQTNFF